jgi:nitrogen fixation/metabolism regulation signal transduction histidine kinase
MTKAEKPASSRFSRKRSRILYEITALIVVVMLVSGLVTFFLVRNSQKGLINKSIDKLVETQASNMKTALNYMVSNLFKTNTEVPNIDLSQLIAAISQQNISDIQRWADKGLKAMVDGGFFSTKAILVIVPASALSPKPFVVGSSDESQVYKWEVPGYISEAINRETPYLLRKEGVPELGLKGTQLVLILKLSNPLMNGSDYDFVAVIPMQKKIDSINAFYNKQSNNLSLTLGLSVFLSIIVMVLIIFFVLRYLIQKRITEPIDVLSAEAEEVMKGNLEIEVAVHENGEFVGLERTFKEMVESIRKFIAKSVGED